MSSLAPRYVVCVDDPCTVGRRVFPRERGFALLREAERYATRANHYRLGATIAPVAVAPRRSRVHVHP